MPATPHMKRPTHPDYSLILQAIADSDDSVDEAYKRKGCPDEISPQALMDEAYGHLVDGNSMHRAATDRAGHAMQSMGLATFILDPESALGALWADAFLAGIRFVQMGGHAA